MPSRLEFDFSFSPDRGAGERLHPERFRLLVLGDFSGRGPGISEHEARPADRRIIQIDVDSFDDVLNRLAPSIALAPASDALELRHLDDFHPDRLRSDVPELRRLMALRDSLDDTATVHQVMAMLGLEQTEATEESPPLPPESTDDLVERLLGQAPVPEHRPGAKVVEQLVREAVTPHVQSPTDPRRAALAAGLEQRLADTTRRLLHQPAFENLEALWRATWWLVSGLETGEELSVHILDVSHEELAHELATGHADPDNGILGRALAEHGAGQLGAENWSVVIGAYSFRAAVDDLKLLALLGASTAQVGSPFLAAADESLLGCRSIGETPDPRQWNTREKPVEAAWQALRKSAIAPWIGLALPRLLLRLPYGKDTDPVSAFPFEEATFPGDLSSLLWGNPAIGCALLLGRSFQASGWEMTPDDHLELEDLPAYSYRADGESHLAAVAEHYLNDRQAEAILANGIMPFISHRQYSTARLLRFQSIADPVTALPGPWAGK